MIVLCPYCKEASELVDSIEVYSRSYGMIWLCRPCQAWVGCHKNSIDHAPLGRLADAELRHWKKAAHAAFDPLWKEGNWKRKQAYNWLANNLGIKVSKCHIGMFDVDMCRRVIWTCKNGKNLNKAYE